MTSMQGLSSIEVQQRRQAGQINVITSSTSRGYFRILTDNVLNFPNIALITIGIALVILGLPQDAISTAGLVIFNIIVGIVQEVRTKRKLDRLALLNRPTTIVRRDGNNLEIDPAEIVQDDLIVIAAGTQLVCDGTLLTRTPLEMDEALLTGESDAISKEKGDQLYAGTVCLAGSGMYQASHIGESTRAAKLTARARQFRTARTPLQQDIRKIITVVAMATTIMGALNSLTYYAADFTTYIQSLAVIVGLIPQGLIVLTTVSYGLGAVRMARRSVLAQQMNAIESMSNIDVLCTDKTGTLTTNQLAVFDIQAQNSDRAAFEVALGTFAASISSSNRTNDALRSAFPANGKKPLAEVPFTSDRKWSGILLDDGAYILAAPEVIKAPLPSTIEQWMQDGLRVVVLGIAYHAQALQTLPDDITPLGFIALRDELRPDVAPTLQDFRQAGVMLKILSGDNPQSVYALATKAGFPKGHKVISGYDLDAISDDAIFQQVVEETAIFGRITPHQKERIIQALQANGHYVAMVGDGVNDVVALKQADLSIALQSGATAARSIADIVLLGDDFQTLPSILVEGQRILNGMFDTMRLLLSRTLYTSLLILGVWLLQLPFPFLPRHDVLISFINAGLPPIILALYAVGGVSTHNRISTLARFILPTALAVTLFALPIYALSYHIENDLLYARSTLVTFLTMVGILLIAFLDAPLGNPKQRRHNLGRAMLASATLMILILVWQPMRDFFALTILPAPTYGLLFGLAVLWGICLYSVKPLFKPGHSP